MVQDALDKYGSEDDLAVNSIIYAEVSVQFGSVHQLSEVLPEDTYHRLGLPYEAAFLAGKVFKEYRRRGGVRRSPLPDFFIGAHAQTQNMTLLTRDAKRYRTYFPEVRLVAP